MCKLNIILYLGQILLIDDLYNFFTLRPGFPLTATAAEKPRPHFFHNESLPSTKCTSTSLHHPKIPQSIPVFSDQSPNQSPSSHIVIDSNPNEPPSPSRSDSTSSASPLTATAAEKPRPGTIDNESLACNPNQPPSFMSDKSSLPRDKSDSATSPSKTTKQTQPGHSSASVPKQSGSPHRKPLCPSTHLPLSGMRREFYDQRGKLFYKNSKRKSDTVNAQDGSKCRRSKIRGSLKDNIGSLNNKLLFCKLHQSDLFAECHSLCC